MCGQSFDVKGGVHILTTVFFRAKTTEYISSNLPKAVTLPACSRKLPFLRFYFIYSSAQFVHPNIWIVP
jgi:hypothetical protein